MWDWSPIWLTFKLAFFSALFLLFVGGLIAYGLSRLNKRWQPVLESIITLPIVLPPTVLGFYLLVIFSPENAFGAFISKELGINMLFSFEGLIFASIIYSLPFMVQPVYTGIKSLPANIIYASYSLGAGKTETLRRIIIPNCMPYFITGFILSFAHTLGEFGVILMIGGAIPGETRVASIAIYEEVEKLNYALAGKYSVFMLFISFAILFLINMLQTRFNPTLKS